MKNRFFLCVLSVLIVFSVGFTVSADSVNDAIISCSFENADYDTDFSRENPHGDLNSDGSLNGTDLIILRQYLLSSDSSYVSQYDINEDSKINILDLVRLKKAIVGFVEMYVQDKDISSRVLVIDGTVTYTDNLISLLEPNTLYQISYHYKSDNGQALSISISGASDTAVNYYSGTEKEWTQKHHLLKTGSILTENTGNELIIVGKGRIDELVITKVTDYWYDSDLSEQGGYDRFFDN